MSTDKNNRKIIIVKYGNVLRDENCLFTGFNMKPFSAF